MFGGYMQPVVHMLAVGGQSTPFCVTVETTMAQMHCIISGRVQGVSFRNFVQNIARDMNLTGFVANLPDGSLEVLAQGEYGVLKVFLQHLSHGPDGSIVTGLYDEWNDNTESTFEGFKIV
jgi:acylphosphatase